MGRDKMGKFRIINAKEYKNNQLGTELRDLRDLQHRASKFTSKSFYLRHEGDGEVYQYKMRILLIKKSIPRLFHVVFGSFNVNVEIGKSGSMGKFSLLNPKQYECNHPGSEISDLRQLDSEAKKLKKEKFYLKYEKDWKEYLYEMEKFPVQLSFYDFGLDFDK